MSGAGPLLRLSIVKNLMTIMSMLLSLMTTVANSSVVATVEITSANPKYRLQYTVASIARENEPVVKSLEGGFSIEFSSERDSFYIRRSINVRLVPVKPEENLIFSDATFSLDLLVSPLWTGFDESQNKKVSIKVKIPDTLVDSKISAIIKSSDTFGQFIISTIVLEHLKNSGFPVSDSFSSQFVSVQLASAMKLVADPEFGVWIEFPVSAVENAIAIQSTENNVILSIIKTYLASRYRTHDLNFIDGMIAKGRCAQAELLVVDVSEYVNRSNDSSFLVDKLTGRNDSESVNSVKYFFDDLTNKIAERKKLLAEKCAEKCSVQANPMANAEEFAKCLSQQ